MKGFGKIQPKRAAVAVLACLGLCAIALAAPMYPCGYSDASTGVYAGYGYHSLGAVLAEGLEWESAEVPVRSENYTGSGPYHVNAEAWIILLYVPIFLAIGYLGLEVAAGRFPSTPSTSSAESPERTQRSRTPR